MERYWWWIIGFLLLLLIVTIYYNSSKNTHVIQANENPSNQVSMFAQNWHDSYLSQRPAKCLQYLPTFHGEFWNNTPASKFNNCYAYAFRNLDLNRKHKPQPGELSNKKEIPKTEYTCENIFSNVTSDHPGTFKWDSRKPCPCGTFKGFLALSKKDPDYHFLREDSNGFWSQKLGGGSATQYDAKGNLITDPFTANLDYGQYNYSTRCSAFCTPYEKNDTQWNYWRLLLLYNGKKKEGLSGAGWYEVPTKYWDYGTELPITIEIVAKTQFDNDILKAQKYALDKYKSYISCPDSQRTMLLSWTKTGYAGINVYDTPPKTIKDLKDLPENDKTERAFVYTCKKSLLP